MEPITMTRAQYQATYGAPPNVPPVTPQPTQVDQTPVTMTRAQYQATYGQAPNAGIDLLRPAKESIKNLGTLYSGGEQGIANKLKTDISGGAEDIQKGNILGGAAKTAFRTAGDVAGAIYAPVGAALGATGINKVFDFLGKVSQMGGKYNPINAITDIKSVQDFVAKNPHLEEDFGRAMNLTLGALDKGIIKPEDVVPRTIEQVKSIETSIKNNIASPFEASNLTPEQTQAQFKKVADDWAKPTTINEPKYNNARAVLAKDPEVPNTLAQHGLNPFEHIEDGKYVTKDSAQQLRNDTGKLSRDILRPSLQMADYSIEKTAVADLKPKANDFGVTPDDAEAIQTRVQTKLDALGRKYPEGMSLTDMLDEKITYDKNGGYNQFKSNADTNDAIANRSIADNLRNQLLTKVPKDLPIEDFFAEQAKNYRAADYLKSLNGAKAPVDIGQTIARNIAKFGGAKLGAMVGGDVVSSFAGYQIGKVLEKFVENMTNPMRDSFLKNLKVTNPEAFTKMQEYMIKNKK